MIISDLNYLEDTTEQVLGGDRAWDVDINKDVTITIDETLDINKDVYSNVNVDDNLAYAQGDANADGNNGIAEVFVFTYTGPNQAHASGSAFSATD